VKTSDILSFKSFPWCISVSSAQLLSVSPTCAMSQSMPRCCIGNITRSSASYFCIFCTPVPPKTKMSYVSNVRGTVKAV